MIENETGMISSVGALGVDVQRSDERAYWTYQYGPVSELHELVEGFEMLKEVSDHEDRSRAVFRSLINGEVLREAAQTDDTILDDIEIAFQLEGTRTDDLWLIGLAKNREDRVPLHSVENIIRETDLTSSRARAEGVVELYAPVFPNFDLQTNIRDAQISDLHELWGNTFGWTREGIVALQNTLHAQDGVDPNDRQTWFSGISDRATGKLVSAATAERLQFRESDGSPISLVENTEWAVHPSMRRRGLNAATIAFLNGQVFTDLSDFPTIVAECNFGSRSDIPAYKAGFSIPEREYSGRTFQQVLEQNVVVNDGEMSDGLLRDFTLNVVRKAESDALYPRALTALMVNAVRSQEGAK
ncbi:MAG: hypothetical protein KBC15_00275 [Candidatus Levybacteria bacterium]|nr:hypothetical protein [Candidatus Levybacteria bacterium]